MSKYFSTIRRIFRQLDETRVGFWPVYIIFFLLTFFNFHILHITDNWLALIATLCMTLIIGGSLSIAQITMYEDSDKLKEKSRKYFSDLGFKSKGNDFYEGVFRGFIIQIILVEKSVKGDLIEDIHYKVFYAKDNDDTTLIDDSIYAHTGLDYFNYCNGLFKSISFDSKDLDYEKYLNNLIDFMIKNDLKPITLTEWYLKKNSKEVNSLNYPS